jgi:hypothetical protein
MANLAELAPAERACLLRKPEGELGIAIGKNMNQTNANTLPAPRPTEGVSSHPPLRAAGQCRLQGQHRAWQAVDGRSNGGG